MRDDWTSGSIGRRIHSAFLAVALTSVLVLVVATLVGVDLSQSAAVRTDRERMAADMAAVVGVSYDTAGQWQRGPLDRLEGEAARDGGHLVIVGTDDEVLYGGPVGQGFRDRAVASPITSDGGQVGTLYIGFRDGAGQSAALSMTWLWIAALVAVAVASVTGLVLTRRLTTPLSALTEATRSFAARDRGARAPVGGPGEIGELARTFNAMADEVERSEAARRNMSADVAHELRTPLTALQAGLEELRDGLLPADPATLSALHEEVLRLGRIVEDLSRLAAAESPDPGLDLADLDLSDLVSDTVVVWRTRFDEAGLRLESTIQMGVWVRGDEDRLHQVLVNLLSNALRHGAGGGRVEVTLAGYSGSAALTVRDHGPGIPAAELPHVFDRFYRGTGTGPGAADTSGSAREQGSGLGLAVVKALVTAHGGTVAARSEPGTGAGFTVTLPTIRPAVGEH